MKNIFLVSLLLTALYACLAACQNNAKKPSAAPVIEHASGDHLHSYVCPMHPEAISDQPGTCPKCNMALEERHLEANQKQYKMDFDTSAIVSAGKEVSLVFTPKIQDNEAAIVPLDMQHEKKIHLIITSSDLSWFKHIHPEFQADGSYVVKTTFPYGGIFKLYADYKPTGADQQLELMSVAVAGKTVATKTWTDEKTSANTTSGYSVNLVPEIGKFVDKAETHIQVKVIKGGKEIMASQLENYLGAKGHMVVVSADGEYRYLHIHPGVEGDRLHLTASFGKVGIYRGWLQFQSEGKVHTADFILNVVDGIGETPTDNHAHNGHNH